MIAAFNVGIEIWEVSNREVLCRAAIEKPIAGPGAAKHNDCQVFTSFHCFCTPSLFRLIQNKDMSVSTKILEVAEFLAQLGLCKPCPQSRRSVVGCVYFSMHGIAAAAPEFGSECLHWLKELKVAVKAQFARLPQATKSAILFNYPNTPGDFKTLRPSLYAMACPGFVNTNDSGR